MALFPGVIYGGQQITFPLNEDHARGFLDATNSVDLQLIECFQDTLNDLSSNGLFGTKGIVQEEYIKQDKICSNFYLSVGAKVYYKNHLLDRKNNIMPPSNYDSIRKVLRCFLPIEASQPTLKPKELSFWAKVSLLFGWSRLTSSSPSHSEISSDLPQPSSQSWRNAASDFLGNLGRWFFFWA